MHRLHFAFISVVLLLGARPLMGSTFYVGTCRIGAFATISAAVSSPTVPAGSMVNVCPGTYAEQVVISKALTLQGIFSSNSSQVIIAVPSAGLTTTSSIAYGGPVAAQVEVTSPGVILKNITVDGTASSNCPSGVYIGIFYSSGAAGTVSGVEARNQNCNSSGIGIVAENGAGLSQTVTVQNNNVNNASWVGIWVCSDQTPSTLTVNIKNNFLAAVSIGVDSECGNGVSPANLAGSISGNDIFPTQIGLQQFSAIPVSGNHITGGAIGINVFNTAVSTAVISGNTADNNSAYGIHLGYGITGSFAVSIISNHISNSGNAGIYLDARADGATIKTNTITQAPIGIEFNCHTDTVTGNTINGAPTGLDTVPAAFTGVNTFYNVATVRTNGAC